MTRAGRFWVSTAAATVLALACLLFWRDGGVESPPPPHEGRAPATSRTQGRDALLGDHQATPPGVGLPSDSVRRSALVVGPVDEPVARAAILGRVIDECGKPLPGWEVRVIGFGPRTLGTRKVKTDGNGRFQVPNRDEGGYLLEVAEKGDDLAVIRREGVRASPIPLELVVNDADRPSACLRGRVVAPEKRVLADCTVLAAALSIHSSCLVRVDEATGAFKLGPMPAGTVHLFVNGPIFQRKYLGQFTLAAGEDRDLGDIRLSELGTLIVHFRPGEVVRSCSVSFAVRDAALDPEYPDFFKSAVEAPSLPLVHGTYVFRWMGQGIEWGERTVSIEAGAETRIDIDLVRVPPVWVVFDVPRDSRATFVQFTATRADGTVACRGGITPRTEGAFLGRVFLQPGEYVLAGESDVGERSSSRLRVGTDDPPDLKHHVEMVTGR